MPTILRIGRYRFHFFSNERNEPAHIHIKDGDRGAKFWLEPVELAANHGFRSYELSEIRRLVIENRMLFIEKCMNTSAKSATTFRRAFVPTTALAQSVTFDDDMMHVALTDGRIISVPIIWFPLLAEATPKQRTKVEIGAGGLNLHWSEIDEDLVVANLLAGADWQAT